VKRGKGMAASPTQRAKVKEADCVVCGTSPCDPAHTVSRAKGGDDHYLCVVPLCRTHHRAYDSEGFSILEYLELDHREEIAYAVKLVGLYTALCLLTNQRWEAA
jgi:hypothetical protein